ncbi:thiol reductase thioredoxin [Archaeoglobales archaeon]|nr:MAG: thiol reductase thioredoxin [Archaeoglobales archaeon]
MIELNKENFDETISNGIVLVDFYSKQCGKCKLIEPILDDLSTKFNVKFAKLNVRENREIARRYGIIGLPVLILFENGKVLGKLKPKSDKEVKEFIESFLKS